MGSNKARYFLEAALLVEGKGETSSLKEEEVVLPGDAMFLEATVSEAQMGSLSSVRGRLQVLGPVATADGSRTGSVSPARGFLRCSGDIVGLGPEVGPVAMASVSISAISDPSPAKGLLWHGFLLRRSSNLASLSCGEVRRPLGLELKPGLVPDLILEPVLVLEQDSVLGPDPNPGLLLDLDPI
jgi:hypothetical protein